MKNITKNLFQDCSDLNGKALASFCVKDLLYAASFASTLAFPEVDISGLAAYLGISALCDLGGFVGTSPAISGSKGSYSFAEKFLFYDLPKIAYRKIKGSGK